MAIETRVRGLQWQASGTFTGDGSPDQLVSILNNVTPAGMIPVIERAFVANATGDQTSGTEQFGINMNEDEKIMFFGAPWVRNMPGTPVFNTAMVPDPDPGIKIYGTSEPVNLELTGQFGEGEDWVVFLSGRFERNAEPLFANTLFPQESDQIAMIGNYFITSSLNVRSNAPAAIVAHVPPGWRPIIDEILPFYPVGGDEDPVLAFSITQNNGAGADIICTMTGQTAFVREGLIWRPRGPYGLIRTAPFEETDDVMCDFGTLSAGQHFDMTFVGHFESA